VNGVKVNIKVAHHLKNQGELQFITRQAYTFHFNLIKLHPYALQFLASPYIVGEFSSIVSVKNVF
jgi:hypothetical protein